MIRMLLPYGVYKVLLGFREHFGTQFDYKDPEYSKWSKELPYV